MKQRSRRHPEQSAPANGNSCCSVVWLDLGAIQLGSSGYGKVMQTAGLRGWAFSTFCSLVFLGRHSRELQAAEHLFLWAICRNRWEGLLERIGWRFKTSYLLRVATMLLLLLLACSWYAL